jgi:hypothetical protein
VTGDVEERLEASISQSIASARESDLGNVERKWPEAGTSRRSAHLELCQSMGASKLPRNGAYQDDSFGWLVARGTAAAHWNVQRHDGDESAVWGEVRRGCL